MGAAGVRSILDRARGLSRKPAFDLAMAGLLSLSALLALEGYASANGNAPDFRRTSDIIYWRKAGMALTMDMFEPAQKNGAAVIFVVSGGWLSSHDDPTIVHVIPEVYEPFLRRGYTVFAVVHGSQPYFAIPDIVLDEERAVRFIRHNAAHYGIDPNRFGITGSSSGGHLALMVATQGAPGAADAPDEIDRESSAVQSVACFFPPTDFLNWGASGVDAVGRGPMAPLVSAFGTIAATDQGRQLTGRLISPIYYVTAKLPPILIIHGDADAVVPLQQSTSFAEKAKEAGAPPVKIIVRKGKGHGWADFWRSKEDIDEFVKWFDATIGK